jgi:hypothetical protein
MKIIDFGPRQLSGSNPVHGRCVSCSPVESELLGIDREIVGLGQLSEISDDARAPIPNSAENVKGKCFDF